ncbi:hypothetical protein QE364_002835 [Nocardioides zeae]|uniref:Uncharacterized protein n=1 Tax=Nocardioides zeae TaxID=1457234 RepID=A0ACC6IK34_9ACTN|nr:hypothetical protein [Nocardioides zeae]MDR6173713.1 hypothetical protein [Nocardioides zeae]MDR6211116.1 hypothetical protein [Nocardioides zeae]
MRRSTTARGAAAVLATAAAVLVGIAGVQLLDREPATRVVDVSPPEAATAAAGEEGWECPEPTPGAEPTAEGPYEAMGVPDAWPAEEPVVASPPPADGLGTGPPGSVLPGEPGGHGAATFGFDRPYDELDGERPTFVWVVGDGGVEGYVFRWDRDSVVRFGAGAVALRAEDGTTVIGRHQPPGLPDYPVNERGQSYGPKVDDLESPDLVEVAGRCGVAGYAEQALFGVPDLPADVDTVEELEAFNAALPTSVPVTESDGVTEVDRIEVMNPVPDYCLSGGSPPTC